MMDRCQFTTEARQELAEILGDAERAARIEADCDFLIRVAPSVAGASGLELRNQAAEVARISRDLLLCLEAKDDGDDRAPSWALLLCAGPAYDTVRATGPIALETDSLSVGDVSHVRWDDLLNHLRAVVASAEARHAQFSTEVRPGRRMAPGLAFLGINICTYLEREGLKRSFSENSLMVRAVAVILRAVGAKNDAREFVRTILSHDKGGN